MTIPETLEAQDAEENPDSYPACGHSACRQNWCDTGETKCVEELDEL